MAEELALEWFRDRIDALGAGGQTARLDTADHADPLVPAVQAGEVIRAWLEREGIPRGKTVLVLPREAVVVRRLRLPMAPENDLPDLVRFQAATKTSAPMDSLILDYLPVQQRGTGDGQDVITVTVDKDRLARMQAVCDAAGLTVEKVTLGALGIGKLVRAAQASDLGMAGPDMVVYQQDAQLEISIFDEGTLVFSHALQLPETLTPESLKPLNSDLTRSLMALSQVHPEASVGRCFYVCGTPRREVLELLRQRFADGLTVVDVSRAAKGRSIAGYEALAGTLLPASMPSLSLDLLHPRQRIEAPDRRRLYVAVASAALLLLAGGSGFYFYSQKSRLETEVADLQKGINTQEEQLQKGKPRADAYARVAKWKESDAQPVELWPLLQKHLPGADRVYLIEFRVVPTSGEVAARFTGRGQARERADVDGLNQSLSDQGFRVRPTTPALGKRDPDYPWQFELDIELPRSQLTDKSPPPAKPVTKS
ncbi:hypothetical protein [Planctomicrobium piriforme]|uniref:Uncharacterized protein n=1 Tax=Planctomicrobium piriforme TaxID=1576369 RepID=A0A1I3IJY5_9PLAN|nr:hypothetical protein [Planctomicrobium piriforme]SFI48308.1 hypothetical protein SAMN05421753_109158 [Planctomicrobium piriforme]